MSIPLVDIFAGPGGLGEGFAALKREGGKPAFRICLSLEKDSVAHKTLLLRATFRILRGTPSVRYYYDYVSGRIDEETFKNMPNVAAAIRVAVLEAQCVELGKTDPDLIDKKIRQALGGAKNWVLIGGPPCQAYSLAGRSRRTNDESFSKDEKHFLYREYLRIIRDHKPAVFVMENVKGLLSSTHSGTGMFEKIIADLSHPRKGLEYEIRSFISRNASGSLKPTDFVIHAEQFGIPQSRHRVILFGVRKDLASIQHRPLTPNKRLANVREAIGALPRIRSRLSRGEDSPSLWWQTVSRSVQAILDSKEVRDKGVLARMTEAVDAATAVSSTGNHFIARRRKKLQRRKKPLERWLSDVRLGGILQHEARSHMKQDLARYVFAASYAQHHGESPRLRNFPHSLLPNHKNVKALGSGSVPFLDRFRVQTDHAPSTTIVSHIAKDGHYYIHYDPSQCRALTVREAARLQTFPDNYYFEGNRTQQYTQVGNAVPPLLAYQLAQRVSSFLAEVDS
jgi:DNA (cytosine-5)-methyltransferase 1